MPFARPKSELSSPKKTHQPPKSAGIFMILSKKQELNTESSADSHLGYVWAQVRRSLIKHDMVKPKEGR
jgi:hypothetical protein